MIHQRVLFFGSHKEDQTGTPQHVAWRLAPVPFRFWHLRFGLEREAQEPHAPELKAWRPLPEPRRYRTFRLNTLRSPFVVEEFLLLLCARLIFLRILAPHR